jgi:DNA polymerase III delta prime subunit
MDQVPVVVQHDRTGFQVRPVFRHGSPPPAGAGPTLSIALDRLQSRLQHDAKLPLPGLHPALLFARARLDSLYVSGRLDLRGDRLRPFVLLVLLQAVGDELFVHVPRFEIVFQRDGSKSLADDLAAVLGRHFELERRRTPGFTLPELKDRRSAIWLQWWRPTLPATRFQKAEDAKAVAQVGRPIGNGAVELQRTSTCLDRLDPHAELRCVHREDVLQQLAVRLAAPGRPAVLLLGESGVGKSALVRELAMRRTERQRRGEEPPGRRGVFWHLQAGRLLAGMKYVGDWECRLEAILGHAQAEDLVLWFDDLLALTTAKASDQTMSMADMVKAAIEDGRCRILGEITQGGLRLLRERHRALAEGFEVVVVPPLDPTSTLRVVLHAARWHESRLRVRFGGWTLRRLPDHVARVANGMVEPGRSLRVLQQMANQAGSRPLGAPGPDEAERNDELNGAELWETVPRPCLDRRFSNWRESLLEFLHGWIRGQPDVVECLCDVALLVHHGLGDPERPLQSLLFVGPTGVGKTESAKALAELLFQNQQRHLLRFDMNQYTDWTQAQRLVGTFEQPDGHLTAAVRRTPAAVLLLDEIEKAHPSVHDLLLQVLGEGRLTDARGRTVDFGQVLVIMTSNLGAAEASGRIAIGEAEVHGIHEQAVRRFFRPEFVNRIDRIVPFSPLPRQAIAELLDGELHRLTGRGDLLRRRVALQVTPAAREFLMEHGYHPQLGARALQRAVHRHVVRLLSEPLAARTGADFLAVVYRRGAGLACELQQLSEAAPRRLAEDATSEESADLPALCRQLEARHRELAGVLAGGAVPTEVAEELERLFLAPVLELLRTVEQAQHGGKERASLRGRQPSSKRHQTTQDRHSSFADAEIDDFLAEAGAVALAGFRGALREAVQSLQVADLMLSLPWPGPVLVHVVSLGLDASIASSYSETAPSNLILGPFLRLAAELELPIEPVAMEGDRVVAFAAAGVLAALLQRCAGTCQSFPCFPGRLWELVVAPLADQADAAAELAAARARRSAAIASLDAGSGDFSCLQAPPVVFRNHPITDESLDSTLVDVPAVFVPMGESHMDWHAFTRSLLVRWLLAEPIAPSEERP